MTLYIYVVVRGTQVCLAAAPGASKLQTRREACCCRLAACWAVVWPSRCRCCCSAKLRRCRYMLTGPPSRLVGPICSSSAADRVTACLEGSSGSPAMAPATRHRAPSAALRVVLCVFAALSPITLATRSLKAPVNTTFPDFPILNASSLTVRLSRGGSWTLV